MTRAEAAAEGTSAFAAPARRQNAARASTEYTGYLIEELLSGRDRSAAARRMMGKDDAGPREPTPDRRVTRS
jgi:hypothetical protein